jgi:hypothetical protein
MAMGFQGREGVRRILAFFQMANEAQVQIVSTKLLFQNVSPPWFFKVPTVQQCTSLHRVKILFFGNSKAKSRNFVKNSTR